MTSPQSLSDRFTLLTIFVIKQSFTFVIKQSFTFVMKQSFTLVLICLFSQFLLAQENTEYCCGNKMDTVITLPHVVLPFGKYPQKVTVGVKNGNAFMEGDIDLGPLKDLIAKATEAESGVAIDAATYRWSNATIPYIINTDFSAAYQATILQAITYLDAQTNLCLVPRSQETDYVTFRTGTGCSSSVGRIGGQQFITLGNCSLGSVVHEICHAAGLYHEQSRENRNTFVTINLSNVQAGEEHNFNQAITGASDYGAYDYYAIMHYSRTAFAIDPSINTITPKLTLPTQNNVIAINPPLTGTINIGQRQGMTQGEVTTINTLYPTTCSTCNAPGTPSVSSIQATTATVTWPAVSGVSIYRVEIKRTVDAVWTNLGNGTTTSRNLTGLLAATGYQVRIYSVCSSTSTSNPSNIATFTTLAGPCNAPGTPSVSSIQATTATVSWPAVSGVSTYRVELKRTVDAAWSNLGNTALTSTGLTNLVANTSYQVRIYSVCSSSSTSNPSNIATFTTLAGSYDNPCGALTFTPITACNQTVMTNINASATATPPPPGGCGIDNIRDVWFRCQSPATGKVNITTFPGTMTDGVIGLYFGNDCGNLSYYNCWDDTNGDEMPDIWASISPGNWIYLRYWGYEGAVGSFSVCVQIAPASNIDNTPRAGITEKPLALEASSRTPQSTSMETSNTQSGNRAMLRVAPNPAHEYLTFHTDKLENIHHVQVLGADGREMLSQNFSLVSSDFSLDVRALPTGMYVLKASLESGGIAIGRFVKE